MNVYKKETRITQGVCLQHNTNFYKDTFFSGIGTTPPPLRPPAGQVPGGPIGVWLGPLLCVTAPWLWPAPSHSPSSLLLSRPFYFLLTRRFEQTFITAASPSSSPSLLIALENFCLCCPGGSRSAPNSNGEGNVPTVVAFLFRFRRSNCRIFWIFYPNQKPNGADGNC